MKSYKALLAITAMISSSLFAQELIPQPDVKWVPVHGAQNEDIILYYDAYGVKQSTTETGARYSVAGLLFVSKTPDTISVEGVKIKINSLVKQIIMNCDTGDVTVSVEFYFDIAMPTRDDVPIAAFDYDGKPEAYITLSKFSPIYKTACAEYI